MLVPRYVTNAYDIGHVVIWVSSLLVSVLGHAFSILSLCMMDMQAFLCGNEEFVCHRKCESESHLVLKGRHDTGKPKNVLVANQVLTLSLGCFSGSGGTGVKVCSV